MSALVTEDLQQAADVLRSGNIVLHATEGVWGFACDALSQSALRKVMQLKQRDERKGLILIAALHSDFAAHLQALPHAQQVIDSWPGPHTWVLPNRDQFSALVTGGRDSVACRVPGHAQARDLCAAFGGVLVSTSANISGRQPVVTQDQAQHAFADQVECIVRGAVLNAGVPSTIHGLDGTILRNG